MSAVRRSIVAIGGGGFLMDDMRGLQERYLLQLCRERASPRVLFVGTAGGDAATGQLKFFRLFTGLGCRPDVLPFFPYDMWRDYARAVREADLVYVGGGNTPAMVAVWREFGFDAQLRAAYEQGTVIAGISAGANCWFEQYVTDSVPGGGVRPGLGWLPGTFCPHLDSEPWRQQVLAAQGAPSVGAGDHVMVRYDDEQWCEALHTHKAAALCLRRRVGEAQVCAVQPRALVDAPRGGVGAGDA